MKKFIIYVLALLPLIAMAQQQEPVVKVHEVVNVGNSLELGMASNLIKDQNGAQLYNGWWSDEGELRVIPKWREFPAAFPPSFDSSDGIVRYSKTFPDQYIYRNNDSLQLITSSNPFPVFLFDLDAPWTGDSCNTYKPKTLGSLKSVIWQDRVILFNGYMYPLVYEPDLRKIDRYLGKIMEGRADTIKNDRAVIKDLGFPNYELANLFFYVDTASGLVNDRCARIKGNIKDTIFFENFLSRTNNNLLNQKFRIFSAPAIRYIVDTFRVDTFSKAVGNDSMTIRTDTIEHHTPCGGSNKYIYPDSTYYLEFITGSATGSILKIANAVKSLSAGRWIWDLYLLPATDTVWKDSTWYWKPGIGRVAISPIKVANRIFSESRMDIKQGDKFIVWSYDMPRPTAGLVYHDRLWLFGDPNKGNACFFSNPGRMNEFPVLNQLSLGQTGIWQNITYASLFYTEEMAAPYDYIGVWKQNSSYKIYDDLNGQIAAYSLWDDKGAVSPNAIVKLEPGQFFFRSWDGWYLTNGNNYTKVLNQLDTLTILENLDSVYVADYKDKILITCKSKGSTKLKGFVWNPKTNSVSETSLLFTNYSNRFFPSDPVFIFADTSFDTLRRFYQMGDSIATTPAVTKDFKFKTKHFDFYPGGYERWLELDVDYNITADSFLIKLYRDTGTTVLQKIKYTDTGNCTKKIFLNDRIVGDAISIGFEAYGVTYLSIPRYRIYYTAEGRI